MMLVVLGLMSILLWGETLSQSCTDTQHVCKTPNGAYCSGDSLTSGIIFHCSGGCPSLGNCNDNLSGVPPAGIKIGALCWQDNATAGDAQCTYDCVNVTTSNGTKFYPVGCDFLKSNTTGAPSSISLSLPTSTSPPSSSTTSQAAGAQKTNGGHPAVRFRGVTAALLGAVGLLIEY